MGYLCGLYTGGRGVVHHGVTAATVADDSDTVDPVDPASLAKLVPCGAKYVIGSIKVPDLEKCSLTSAPSPPSTTTSPRLCPSKCLHPLLSFSVYAFDGKFHQERTHHHLQQFIVEIGNGALFGRGTCCAGSIFHHTDLQQWFYPIIPLRLHFA